MVKVEIELYFFIYGKYLTTLIMDLSPSVHTIIQIMRAKLIGLGFKQVQADYFLDVPDSTRNNTDALALELFTELQRDWIDQYVIWTTLKTKFSNKTKTGQIIASFTVNRAVDEVDDEPERDRGIDFGNWVHP